MEHQLMYRRKDAIVIVENSGALSLIYGDRTLQSTRWLLSENAFQQLRTQNPDVTFTDAAMDSKSQLA
jgi:hypothetical protein